MWFLVLTQLDWYNDVIEKIARQYNVCLWIWCMVQWRACLIWRMWTEHNALSQTLLDYGKQVGGLTWYLTA